MRPVATLRPLLAGAVLVAGGVACTPGGGLSSVTALRPPASLDRTEPAPPREEEPARPRPAVDPRLLPDTIVRGDPRRKQVALTFDDGPHPGYTDRLLTLLSAFDCPATFFVIGRNVEASPAVVARAVRLGVEIGNHTWNHRRLTGLSDEEVRAELATTSTLIERVTGRRPVWYRPPGGQRDAEVGAAARSLGLRLALWSAEGADYTTFAGNPHAETILRNVLRNVHPGAVVILHDPMPGTLQVLPSIILALRLQGYEFVTLSELAAQPGAVTTGSPAVRRNPALARRELERIGYLPGLTQGKPHENPQQRAPQPPATKGQAREGVDQGGR